MSVLRAVLDANCFIDAASPQSKVFADMRCLLQAHSVGRIQLNVSRHTLSELHSQSAQLVASAIPIVPHFPIGTWEDQVASWQDVSGTWAESARNELLQLEVSTLAKAGSSLRDRGAYLDALISSADVFITSDKQLVGSAPAVRIQSRFGLRVATPSQVASELAQNGL